MSVIEDVKQRIDIVELISRYVSLTKAGRSYKANCPFHDERTPSFIVFPDTGTWRCFGQCGIGGDVFSFLMQKENLDFRDALQTLATEAGVQLEDDVESLESRKRRLLYQLNQAAADYFCENLESHPAAQRARDYLSDRQIDAATIKLFQLGYSLDSWDGLQNHLTRLGHQLDDLVEAGLLKRNEERNSTYDAFRARLMIPIRDRQGRVIGFGGRVLDDSQPKYLNTAETVLFHKSRVIYGLDLAHRAIRVADRVVIVEGYMDVIAAHQYGFNNVVACMGTSLTAEQLRELQRYTRNYILALDADAAGQQATMRGLNQARQALVRVQKPRLMASGQVQIEERLGANLSIVAMPEGRDPDDVIRDDPTLWTQLVDDAQLLVDYYFQVVSEQVDLSSPHGKAAAVSELAPLIAELDNEIEQQHYVQQLSRLVQIDEQTIANRVLAASKTQQVVGQRIDRRQRSSGKGKRLEQTSKFLNSNQTQVDHELSLPPAVRAESDLQTTNRFGSAHQSQAFSRPSIDPESYLLARLISEPDLLIWLASATEDLEIPSLHTDDLLRAENKEILRALKLFITTDEQWDLELFQETVTEHLHGYLVGLMVHGAQLPSGHKITDVQQDILKVLVRLRIQHIQTENRQLQFLEDEAQHNKDLSTAKSYGITKNKNIRNLYHLQQVLARLSHVLSGPSSPGMKKSSFHTTRKLVNSKRVF
ncbi:DNA primase [Chloroflexi bacterium TSY]|nr:DNA primase [Chloroflexi bacterium TSY]